MKGSFRIQLSIIEEQACKKIKMWGVNKLGFLLGRDVYYLEIVGFYKLAEWNSDNIGTLRAERAL